MTSTKILYLPINMIHSPQRNRGKTTDKLQELAASISQVGILQPLTVRKTGDAYTLVSGSRRLMAAKLAGLNQVPCLLTERTDLDAPLLQLTENLQREDLHYFDEAKLLQEYLTNTQLTQLQAAKKLGRSQSAIANKLRLLQHSAKLQDYLREQRLSERHARELLRIPGETQRLEAAREISARNLSVAQTERYIDVYLENHSHPGDPRYRLRDTRLFLQRLDQDTALLRHMGIAAEMERREDEKEIVLTVRIPQESGCR